MKGTYLIAGAIPEGGKKKRVCGLVEVEADTEFGMEIKALGMLPAECHTHRHGKHIPDCWPLESEQGTRIAIAAGLVQPEHALSGR